MILSRCILNSVKEAEYLRKSQSLWKVRAKKFRGSLYNVYYCIFTFKLIVSGIKFYKRKYWIDYNKLYLHYAPANNPVSQQLYNVAPNKMYRSVKML